jgi:hypothetical protein
MRRLIAGATTLATIAVVSGCTSIPPEPPPVIDMTMRQNVKIYDVLPPFSTPIEQIAATVCGGSREMATDRLVGITVQRGGNGLMGLACRTEGISFSCWSSITCTATAINVAPPPPPPPPPPRRHKPKPKKT